jgi:hypothetical protein
MSQFVRTQPMSGTLCRDLHRPRINNTAETWVVKYLSIDFTLNVVSFSNEAVQTHYHYFLCVLAWNLGLYRLCSKENRNNNRHWQDRPTGSV